jgi:predicted ATPase
MPPTARPVLRAPFLRRLSLRPERIDPASFPFSALPFLGETFALEFGRAITILAGENGSGKSTLLEAIAAASGFGRRGGSQDHVAAAPPDEAGDALAAALRLAWLPRIRNGFFLRAESFFQLAAYLDEAGDPGRHGGRALHALSHGESFMAMFRHRLESRHPALYILDEPEAALSPQRQLAFLHMLRDWQAAGTVQAIVATHSPILMSLPGADLLWLDGAGLRPIRAEETPHWRIYQAFLANPARFLAGG